MCRHKIDRVTIVSLIPGVSEKYRCCKCGKQIRQTFLSSLIMHFLYWATICFVAWFLFAKMRLSSQVIGVLIIVASILIEGAVYMRFFAKYCEIENEG